MMPAFLQKSSTNMKYLIHQKSGRVIGVEGEKVTVLIEQYIAVSPTEEKDILEMCVDDFFRLYDEPRHTTRAINMARGFYYYADHKPSPKGTVRELITLSRHDILYQRNSGGKTLAYIERCLAHHGLKLSNA